MRIVEYAYFGSIVKRAALACSIMLASGVHATAFDKQRGAEGPAPAQERFGMTRARPESPRANIMMRLRFGLQAYKKGHKDEAFEAYSEAAEHGHPGARWKLAHMYAHGEGVAENHYEAFKLFERIVREGAAPGTNDGAFVASALVSLAGYFQTGIPGTTVDRDPLRARDLYFQAATSFGEPTAQFEIGRMHFGDGTNPDGQRQAAKWFNQAAKKGHAGAKAMLGHIHFQHGRHVSGLALLTEAIKTAEPDDVVWIRPLQEEAFALADEAQRRTAIARAQENVGAR
ncbi:MAG: tetratricopeptide repeat protein [Pseudomonadota bacterium]